MPVVVVTPPAGLVSYPLAKKHLRLEETDDSEKDLIEAYIAAATAWIDGPTGWLGRTVLSQTLELRCNTFSGADVLPYGPATEIVSVKYISPAGIEETLDADRYEIVAGGLSLKEGASWPSLRGDAEGVRVQYQSGGDTAPASIQQAVLLLIGQWFRNRMAVNTGNLSVTEMPFGVEALLAPFRTWR
ncbi:head-tail connector protein [Brevundimonas diminuta]|uniref:head-tail connector protein n=1 Tax=Brevundimonas diminuta TaxID=293 RepID=UPI0030FA0F76